MDGSKPGFHTYLIPIPLGGNRWEWNVGQTKSYSTSPSPPVFRVNLHSGASPFVSVHLPMMTLGERSAVPPRGSHHLGHRLSSPYGRLVQKPELFL